MTPDQLAALQKFRDSRDPLKHYIPRPTQDRFHRSMARHKLLAGGLRSGKTGAGLADLAMKLRGIHPHHKWFGPLRIWMWGMSRSQGSSVLGRKLFEASELKGPCENFPMIPSWEIEDLGTMKVGGIRIPQRCLLKNGSELLFGWSGVEKSWARFQGIQLHGVAFDEAACEGKILTESKFRVADHRARHAETNPWVGWIYWFAAGTQADDNYEMFRNACKDDTVDDYEIFEIPASERPAEVQSVMDSISLTLSQEDIDIRVKGTTTAGAELQIYAKQWSDERHMRKTDYVVQPNDNLWAVYDPGVDHPTGIAFAALNAENPLKLRFVKYIQRRRLTLEDEVELICEYLRGRVLEGLIYDIASHKVEKTGLSVKNQLLAILMRRKVRMVRGMIPGRNRHADGIARVRTYLDPDPSNPLVEPLIEFNSSEESGCQVIRSQMLKYRSYEPGKYTGAKGVVKKDDEGPDLVRYACSLTPAYNPTIGCGYPEPETPTAPLVLTPEQLRIQAQMERSRQMAKQLEDRDLGFSSVSLW